jgi:hypothetical protein
MDGGESGIRIAWLVGIASLWPVVVLVAFHVVWGPIPAVLVLQALGLGLLFVAPGLLAVATADDSAWWRRTTAMAVAVVTAAAVIAYGTLLDHNMYCHPAVPAEVLPTMVPVGVIAGLGTGLTAWQGGRLVARGHWWRIALAFVFGWAMLALAFGAVIFREFSTGCFGY